MVQVAGEHLTCAILLFLAAVVSKVNREPPAACTRTRMPLVLLIFIVHSHDTVLLSKHYRSKCTRSVDRLL